MMANAYRRRGGLVAGFLTSQMCAVCHVRGPGSGKESEIGGCLAVEVLSERASVSYADMGRH